MSDENQEVEQITKNPLPAKSGTKEKDPKKVAAGKKLAEYNRKAKEALAREMKREAETPPEEPTDGGTNESRAWIPELSFTTVLSLVGIGFTALDMYMRFYKKKEGEQSKNNSEQSKNNSEQSKTSTQPTKIPVATKPKIGML